MTLHDNDLKRSAGFMMGTAYRKISALFQSKLKEYDITTEQWSVLYQVDQSEGLIQKEIAERSGKDRPATTRILDQLEQKGLVGKRVGEHDRRSFKVYITDKGRELVQRTAPIERQLNADLRQCLSEEEYDVLLELLYRMYRHASDIAERD
ncbi:MarR family winged helix-turn-helix transcriptional regulator [Cohnella terricola]|uniref:MarR family transcriptional regulator n=1 Tax=Cohnella terricola TaxID=1289167 RepID=A0A559J7W5_9BACL|nr:MarR family transcriptional regulator [Cohnella terricola]TVX95951.1 MarR family transcriptional regulator [Cohnella terricola]